MKYNVVDPATGQVVGTMELSTGQASGGTPSTPPSISAVPPVDSAPAPFYDCGTGGGNVPATDVVPGQIVGVSLEIIDGTRTREIIWESVNGGRTWNRTSWGLFDAAGNKVLGETDVAVAGTLNAKIEAPTLAGLPGGKYVFGAAVDGTTRLGFNFQQS